MSKSNYILINQPFAIAHQFDASGSQRFGYGITKTGQYVVAQNTIDEFPEIFAGELPFPGIIVVAYDDITDFPPQIPFP